MDCVFCNIKNTVIENEYAYAIFDRYPASKGHMLIIPKRHFADYFDITEEERKAVLILLDECKKILDTNYHPDGYNIGINCGEAAGQTIWHLHIHLIPRYIGDVDDPRGGIRGAIPSKRIYG
jgi:diadenosine tetraphosphate (Ap4A) HIT family hydrolase